MTAQSAATELLARLDRNAEAYKRLEGNLRTLAQMQRELIKDLEDFCRDCGIEVVRVAKPKEHSHDAERH